MPRSTTRDSRKPLTRQRALEAGLQVADRDGIAALSMRRVARELGVEAMSLYHHVANKDDLLDGMVDLLFAEIEVPEPSGDWIADLRKRAWSARAALLRHPWAVSLLDSRSSPGPATLRHHDAVIGLGRAAGIPYHAIAHAGPIIDAFIYGFVMQEMALPFASPEELQELAEEMIGFIPAEQFPHLHTFTVDHILATNFRLQAEFDYGLEMILAGLAKAAQNASPGTISRLEEQV